ncbi:hypothetical protein CHS0354_030893 [Potamilus streckersoni]|uniref:Uncharacterized protein n=1 Tax=Potamilus streckersoni TaxID=2493646 RepID=A0AAE0SAK0_9BIVA|nr:hypothetical protein CHS0354_030893 [Potamilus streckersoni]
MTLPGTAYFVVIVVVIRFNTIFQHKIGSTWRLILMVEEEPWKTLGRTNDPKEATGRLFHLPTLAEFRLELTAFFVLRNYVKPKTTTKKVTDKTCSSTFISL